MTLNQLFKECFLSFWLFSVPWLVSTFQPPFVKVLCINTTVVGKKTTKNSRCVFLSSHFFFPHQRLIYPEQRLFLSPHFQNSVSFHSGVHSGHNRPSTLNHLFFVPPQIDFLNCVFKEIEGAPIATHSSAPRLCAPLAALSLHFVKRTYFVLISRHPPFFCD